MNRNKYFILETASYNTKKMKRKKVTCSETMDCFYLKMTSLKIMGFSQPNNIIPESKSTIETLKKCVKYVQSSRPYLRSETIFDNRKPFKNDEKCFSFHVKSSFCYSILLLSSS